MPTILSIFGLRFFFYTREHEPIHVHIEHADGVAKYNLLDDRVALVENKVLNPQHSALPSQFSKRTE